jgi:DNA-nicking Smr family endonuclease
MPKKSKISQEDLNAFYEAVKGIKPLVQKKIRISPIPPHRKPQQPIRRTPSENESLLFKETDDLPDVRGEEFIAYKQESVPSKTLRKLRKGQYNVDAMLDLHGMSVEEAKIAVESFLQQCLREAMRVVLIIHGKGRGHQSQVPVLKNKLNHWLRGINVVLAFCSAAPSHGSRGAIYVLLKCTPEENFA